MYAYAAATCRSTFLSYATPGDVPYAGYSTNTTFARQHSASLAQSA
jgi:hypothetical protein